MASRTRRIMASTIAPVLIAGGIAVAAQGGGDNQGGNGTGHRGPPGPPFANNLTYGELHVQKDGQAKVIRVDRGKVKTTASGAITITENDGNDVTIPIDGDTKVFAGPDKGRNATVSDLSEGQLVTVDREQGQAAHVIAVMPKRGEHPPHGPQGPPPSDSNNG